MNRDVNFCGTFVINYKNVAPELSERFEYTDININLQLFKPHLKL